MTDNDEKDNEKEDVKHFEIPKEALDIIKEHCIENGCGVAVMGGTEYCVLIMGSANIRPEEAHILGAYTLLEFVVTGRIQEENQKMLQSMIVDISDKKH